MQATKPKYKILLTRKLFLWESCIIIHPILLFSASMGGKLEDVEFKKRNFVPGPGQHSPELSKDVPSMKFGSGQRG